MDNSNMTDLIVSLYQLQSDYYNNLVNLIINKSDQDAVAVYGALLSTLIAFWELYKWRTRVNICVDYSSNMEFYPNVDNKKYVVLTVTNRGATPTTITNFLGKHYADIYSYIKRKPKTCFIVKEDSIPKTLNPGEEWKGLLLQDDGVEKMSKEGLLYMGISHSMHKKEKMTRVKSI